MNINITYTAPMFKVTLNGLKGFLCPGCETITVGRFTQFLKEHYTHLSPLTPTRRERIFLKVITQQQQQQQQQQQAQEEQQQPQAQEQQQQEQEHPEEYQEEEEQSIPIHQVGSGAIRVDDNITSLSQPTSNNEPDIVNVPINNPIRRREDLQRTYVTLSSNVSADESPEIVVPENLLADLISTVRQMGSAKVQFGLSVEFEKDDGEVKPWQLSNKAMVLSSTFINDGILQLKEKIETYSQLSSGWRILRVLEVSMIITKISEIIHVSGSSYIPTPKHLSNSKSIINVKNKDQFCFLYSILAVKHYNDFDTVRHRERIGRYNTNELKFKPEWFPMKIVNVPKFEALNPELSINILIFNNEKDENSSDDEIFKNPYVDIVYRSKNDGIPIYILLVENISTFHYMAVTNLDGLLNYIPKEDENINRVQSHWCKICLHGFQNLRAYEKHVALCKKNVDMTTLFTMPENKYIQFDQWRKTVHQKFVVYADFESVLPEDNTYFQRHEPIAAGMLLMADGIPVNYYSFVGSDCVIKFIEMLEVMTNDIVYPWYDQNSKKPMNPMTRVEISDFLKQRKCYLCNREETELVRDHDHFTGQYLGGACQKCNLARQIKPFLPVVFHNLKGYDMHHILKYAMSKFPSWSLNVIPQSTEKFMALTMRKLKKTIRFIDSLQFLNCSLANLAKNVPNLPLTSSIFDNDLVKGKGLFPYDYATSLEVLQTTYELPPIWTDVKQDDYDSAKEVWRRYECRTLEDYMLVYLKLDVYLLTDIFESFRIKAMAEDGLEALSYFTIPGMSWDSALKQLKSPVELIQDPELYKFFEGGIRGGITFVNKHHVQETDNTQLLYIDVNNLYGWALSQKLPCGDFKWLTRESEMQSILEKCKSGHEIDGELGYTLEVDILIPNHIQDRLDDFPVAPETLCPPGSKVKKLLLTHSPKLNYVVHCRLLQIWLSLGIQVTKVHRVIQFKQALIFSEYIAYNSKKRAEATNEFDRDFYKLKSNSLYGKSVENLKKRMNLRLCNTPKKLITYASKAMFRRSIPIADDLVAVLFNKEEVCLDRPSYIGQSVLDLSKLRMYQLHYQDLEWYRDELQCEINIVAGDTDSFFLECKNVDLRSQLLPRMLDDGLLDTSKYSPTDPLYTLDYDSIIGLVKDESKGLGFTEGIFLSPKCYSLEGPKNIMRVKGVNIKGTKVNHASYKEVYLEQTVLSIPQQRIQSINHQLYTVRNTKKALQCYDDKRYWTGLNSSVAYGHYSIEEREECFMH